MILKSLDIGGRKGFPPASLDIGDHTAHYFHVSGIIELLDLTMDGAAAISALGALAQETRLAIYRLLVQCSSDGLAAGAIAERLDLPPSSLSFHLAQLAHARLIVQRREGRSLIYAADYDSMNALLGYLTENCCGGGACAPGCAPAARPAIPSTKRRKIA